MCDQKIIFMLAQVLLKQVHFATIFAANFAIFLRQLRNYQINPLQFKQ